MDIESIKTQIDADIANVSSFQGLEDFRTKYLGRKGIIAQLTAVIPTLPQQERGAFGQQANSLKAKLLSLIEEKQASITGGVQTQKETVDITMPGIAQELGHLHPITQIINEACDIFM